MMRRTNILWGALLACSLLCLGMRPRPLTAESIPQRSKVKIQAQPWKSRLFYRLQRDSTGQYAIYDYCEARAASYQFKGTKLYHDWGMEDETLLIRRTETEGRSYIFVVSPEGSPEHIERIRFTPLDSLGIEWQVGKQRFVDARFRARFPFKHYPCYHDAEDSTEHCGRRPSSWQEREEYDEFPEPEPQGVATQVLAGDWKDKTFLFVEWEEVGQYALRTYQDLNKHPSYRLRGNRLLTQEDEYVILGSEVVGPSRVFTVYNEADTTKQPKRITFSSRDSLGVIWDVNGERYVDSLHLSKVYVKRYVLPHQYELRD